MSNSIDEWSTFDDPEAVPMTRLSLQDIHQAHSQSMHQTDTAFDHDSYFDAGPPPLFPKLSAMENPFDSNFEDPQSFDLPPSSMFTSNPLPSTMDDSTFQHDIDWKPLATINTADNMELPFRPSTTHGISDLEYAPQWYQRDHADITHYEGLPRMPSNTDQAYNFDALPPWSQTVPQYSYQGLPGDMHEPASASSYSPSSWSPEDEEASITVRKRGDFNKISYARTLYIILFEADNHTLSLRDIYRRYFERCTKIKASGGPGYMNSIRHNLSLNEAFVKIKHQDKTAKPPAMWTLSADALRTGRVLPTTHYRPKPSRPHRRGSRAQQQQPSGRALAGQKGGLATRDCRAPKRIQRDQPRRNPPRSFPSGPNNQHHDMTPMQAATPVSAYTPSSEGSSWESYSPVLSTMPYFQAPMAMPTSFPTFDQNYYNQEFQDFNQQSWYPI